jgi:hypothetical protein
VLCSITAGADRFCQAFDVRSGGVQMEEMRPGVVNAGKKHRNTEWTSKSNLNNVKFSE